MIQIFNKIVSGDDLDNFLSLTKLEKFNWIKKNTNQQNDSLIDEFLNSKTVEIKECLDCGKMNNKIVRHGENIGKTDVTENTTNSNKKLGGESSNANSVKRPKKAKRAKD